MYTSYIGKQFLNIYKQKENKSDDYSAKDFFNEVMFPLFFDHNEHLMHVGNSPFFQRVPDRDIKMHGSKSKAQLYKLHQKIEEGLPSGAIFVGYGAEDYLATSSGQTTSLDYNIDSSEMYSSWIGQALGIGVSGGLIMLVDQEMVLWQLFKGWKKYREYINQTKGLKDKQIETWNGHWLVHVNSKKYNKNNPLNKYNPDVQNIMGKLAIPTNDWLTVIVSLSILYPSQKITVNIYNLSQTNTTLGFILINLPTVRNLKQLKELLHPEELEELRGVDKLYDTYYSLKGAARMGMIDIKTLEPKNLRNYMPVGTYRGAKGKELKFSSQLSVRNSGESEEEYSKRSNKWRIKRNQELISLTNFKTWIIAMLNNKKELNILAERIAQCLIDYESNKSNTSANRGTNKKGQLSKDIRSSNSLKVFISHLTLLMKNDASNAQVFKEVKEEIILLPIDLFPLFITLIGFEYQYKKSILNN